MTLPAGVKAIEDEAFLGTVASRIMITPGVESIGAGAFANSTSLRFISVPDSVVSIADSAFADDPNLCVICSENSVAKEYAVSHGIEYTTVSNYLNTHKSERAGGGAIRRLVAVLPNDYIYSWILMDMST